MDLHQLSQRLNRLPPSLVAFAERLMRRVPAVQARVDQEAVSLLAGIGDNLNPYRGEFAAYTRLPAEGRSREAVLEELAALQARERARWEGGYASGAVYHGDEAHIDFLNRVYALHSQSNPLHAD